MDAALAEGAHNVDIIVPVSGETINLMDNDVIHPISVLFDILQHFLEFRSVSGLGGRTPIHELFAHYRPHREGFSFVRLPLGGNGKTFVRAAATLGLPSCRHAKVGHGKLGGHAGGKCLDRIFCIKTH